MIIMFILAILAPELFYIDKDIVNIIEWNPSTWATILYYKNSGFGDFWSLKNTLYAIM